MAGGQPGESQVCWAGIPRLCRGIVEVKLRRLVRARLQDGLKGTRVPLACWQPSVSCFLLARDLLRSEAFKKVVDRLHGVQAPPAKSHKVCSVYVYFSGERLTTSVRLSNRSVAPDELQITAPAGFSRKDLSLMLGGFKRAFGVLGSRAVDTAKLRFLVPEKKNLIW